MKVLAVETATSWQSVAILDDDRVLARCDQDAAGSHARLLLPAVDKLFSQTGLGPAKPVSTRRRSIRLEFPRRFPGMAR